MELIEKLEEIKRYMHDTSGYCLSYKVILDSGEITFEYTTWIGWDIEDKFEGIYNACDYKTNIEGLKKEVEELEKNWGKA
jgi:hypothetical protein